MYDEYPRYQVIVDGFEAILEMNVSDEGIDCEFADGTEKLLALSTPCEVTIMETQPISCLADIIALFTSPKYYTTTGNSESNAFLQEFSEFEVNIGDYDGDSLISSINALQMQLIGKLSKPKIMTLQQVFNKYVED